MYAIALLTLGCLIRGSQGLKIMYLSSWVANNADWILAQSGHLTLITAIRYESL